MRWEDRRIVRVLVGSKIWSRFSSSPDADGYVELLDDLALYSQAGIAVVRAAADDWPPTAMVAVTADGRRHLMQP